MQEILWCSSESEDSEDTKNEKDTCNGGCSDCINKSVINDNNLVFDGWINIYDTGGSLQSNSGIYTSEDRAIESGKLVKGYVVSVYITFPAKLLKTIERA